MLVKFLVKLFLYVVNALNYWHPYICPVIAMPNSAASDFNCEALKLDDELKSD